MAWDERSLFVLPPGNSPNSKSARNNSDTKESPVLFGEDFAQMPSRSRLMRGNLEANKGKGYFGPKPFTGSWIMTSIPKIEVQ